MVIHFIAKHIGKCLYKRPPTTGTKCKEQPLLTMGLLTKEILPKNESSQEPLRFV